MVDCISGGDSIESEPGSTSEHSSMGQHQRSQCDLTSVNSVSTDCPSNGDPLHANSVTAPLNVGDYGDPIDDCHGAGEGV